MTRTDSLAGPTLAIVARAARVSVPTVSKVVNGRDDVAPDTRRRVTEALDRLGYVRRPRSATRAYHPSQVDVVLHSLESSWSGAVLHGVEAAAEEAGLEVVVRTGSGRTTAAGPESRWLDRLAARGSAGVLFNLAELTAAEYSWLDRRGIPFVMIDPVADPPPDVLTVGAANWQGGLSATQHLLALGHRRIAVIGSGPNQLCAGARMAGHRSALAETGLPYRPEYERFAHFDIAEARLRTLELLDLPEPPTAVFVCSDAMALGAYQAVAERGLRIPDDISVVGFDDLPESRWATPALTTVRQPLSDMAAAALRLLVRTMAGDLPESSHIELSTHLVVRGSTAPPAGGTAARLDPPR
ncbi:LacI family DNA-binding transcriptional regulator [Streptomyces sp. CBMA29]|uniref:LacI family DNA-binding transcriptional regulator n=1 Tax=Streptomyces sp. CBMA29 TaxID=1896314 RepID=UPI001661DC89|nr:LacI family DNA-binding transcriptional regulator [Streptomyces sp. CBMA29]MBD0735694.1 LacI family transcriptional regulator [Streptomyces sp. CBMA29]